MKWKVPLIFAAGFATAYLLSLVSGRTCRTGDLARALDTRKSKELEAAFGVWVHQTRQCRIGDYDVVAPVTEGAADILLVRHGKPVFVTSNLITRVLDDDRVVYEWERGRLITYTAYDRTRDAWIENYDINADGSIDTRTIAATGRPRKYEVPGTGVRWLEASR